VDIDHNSVSQDRICWRLGGSIYDCFDELSLVQARTDVDATPEIDCSTSPVKTRVKQAMTFGTDISRGDLFLRSADEILYSIASI